MNYNDYEEPTPTWVEATARKMAEAANDEYFLAFEAGHLAGLGRAWNFPECVDVFVEWCADPENILMHERLKAWEARGGGGGLGVTSATPNANGFFYCEAHGHEQRSPCDQCPTSATGACSKCGNPTAGYDRCSFCDDAASAPRPSEAITLTLAPNEDTVISCIFCRRETPCEYGIDVRRNGERALVGIHADCVAPFRAKNDPRTEYPKVEYHYRCPNEHTGVLATLAQSFRCPTCRAEITWQNCSFNGNPVSWRIGDDVSICINLHPSPIDVAIRSHAAQKRGDDHG